MTTQTDANKGNTGAYFRGVKAEIKKVIWPTKNELINYTAIVILISFVIGLIVWALDLGISRVLSLIIK